MSWADEKIAHPMGFQYAVLFPRAREAIWAYREVTGLSFSLPENICPQILGVYKWNFQPVSSETGLAKIPVQLYGYRQEITGPLEIDPLMTGWGRKPLCESSIVSFGDKKFIKIGYGGAFLTNNQGLAEEIEPCGYWPFDEDSETTALVIASLNLFHRARITRRDQIAKWDAALGDLLPRIPLEQVIPWRVMRRVPHGKRDLVIKRLRDRGIPVGTNYPPLIGSNKWGDEVINFFPECERLEDTAVEIIMVLNG